MLVTPGIHTLLCGFSVVDMPSLGSTDPELQGAETLQYMAPELLMSEPIKTTETDAYAFGISMAQVGLLSKVPEATLLKAIQLVRGTDVPFPDLRSAYLAHVITRGERLRRPDGGMSPIFEAAWRIAELCWQQEPERPPPMSEVRRLLDEMKEGGTD